MNNGNGVSRGDRNRNARLSKLRAAVPVTNAIVGIDLADRKQMVVVTDHDSRVLARRTFRCKAWDLGAALDWAAERATRAGYAGATVSCEPTGHRWRVLGQLAADRGMPFVCVQPMLTSGARKSEDLTTDKTDDKDAVLISRLTAQLRCYLPEPVEETWGRLRHLGVRREQLLDEHIACVQQIRDLLECVWPAAITTAQQPFKSHTWIAALHVIMTRDGGDFTRTRRLGPTRFEHAVRKELTRRGKTRPCLRILRNVYAALADPTGVIAHRRGAFERIGWVLEDWDAARAKLADTETRMITVLDDLELTELACSIRGLSPVGAAAILAETGDLRRFTSSRAVVKHAGLAPRERKSGTFAGRARLAGAGRPHLRAAAWRAAWGAVKANPVYAARYRHLTTRETNKLKPTQAQTVLAGAILRQLHAVITTGQAWDPDIATHGTRTKPTTLTEVAA
ncbi:MAG TPA: IS110 family transposase [Intrasporangium sp.]|nr:IS110 family transposase [Intrasporangium sp.]